MSDDKTVPGGQDRARINVNHDFELRDWSKKFGVTPDQLTKAVASVGDRADAVEKHLKGERKPPRRAEPRAAVAQTRKRSGER